jgi:HSP20 family protein
MATKQERQSETSGAAGQAGTGGTTGLENRPEQRGSGSSEAGNGGERSEQRKQALVAERRGGRRLARMGWPGRFRGAAGASPLELMRRMSEEMDQLFESLDITGTGIAPLGQPGLAGSSRQGTGQGSYGLAALPVFIPQVEVIQRPGSLLVRADLPGLRAEDISVTVDEGLLVISGERRQENKEERDGLIRSELAYGIFTRAIPLPDGADESRISATFRNGVLEVTVPVAARERGRQVSVQADTGTQPTSSSPEPATSGAGNSQETTFR